RKVPARRGARARVADDDAARAVLPPGGRARLQSPRGVRPQSSRARAWHGGARARLGARRPLVDRRRPTAAAAPRAGARGAGARTLAERARGSRLAVPM